MGVGEYGFSSLLIVEDIFALLRKDLDSGITLHTILVAKVSMRCAVNFADRKDI
jgi:hypothetical protein